MDQLSTSQQNLSSALHLDEKETPSVSQEDDYSDGDFEEAEPSQSVSEKMAESHNNSSLFSVSVDGDDPNDPGYDKEIDSERIHVSGLMSTIAEERTPTPSSSSRTISGDFPRDFKNGNNGPQLMVPDELKDLEHYFEQGENDSTTETEAEDSSSSSFKNRNNPPSDNNNTSTAIEDYEPEGVNEILAKLDRLANAQSILENVLEAESTMKESEIEAALKDVISQLPPMMKPKPNSSRYPNEPHAGSNSNNHSLSEAMEALQKVISGDGDPEDFNSHKESHHSVVENDFSRSIDQVLKEYEEIERNLSSSRGGGANSCDEQESLKDEVSPVKKMPMEPNLSGFFSQPISSSSSEECQSASHAIVADNKLEKEKTKTIRKPAIARSTSNLTRPATPPSPLKISKTGGMPTARNSPSKTTISNQNKNNLKGSASVTGAISSVSASSKERPLSAHHKDKVANASHSLLLNSPSQPKRSSNFLNYGGGGEGEYKMLQEQEQELQEQNFKIQKLQGEIKRQETLLDAYQDDNQKLYNALRDQEKEQRQKEIEWEELMSSLKTEIATLKLNRLAPMSSSSPSRPTSAVQRQEVERLKEESVGKSLQITELRREILVLRNNIAELQAAKNTPNRRTIASQEKEKENQRKIQGLQKQVRTLQKIMYSKDPSSVSNLMLTKATSRDDIDMENTTPSARDKTQQIQVLESRILELESDLTKADAEARNRLKDFQAKLTGLKGRYEDQIKEFEIQLEESVMKMKSMENSVSQVALGELQSRLDRSQTEINHLKLEISKGKRELEIAQKSTVNQGVGKTDAATLSLAIKSFKSELAEKEKDIIRMKKEMAELNKTNLTLKREREKYLMGSNILGLNKFPLGKKSTDTNTNNMGLMGMKSVKENANSKIRSPTRQPGGQAQGVSSNENGTTQLLQSTLEFERAEFEEMISNKKIEIEERDKIIQNLRTELEKMKSEGGGGGMDNDKDIDKEEEARTHSKTLEELRSRVTTQNDLIMKLKDHMSHYRRIEEDHLRLKRDNHDAKAQIKQLKQKLDFALTLQKPEHEILAALGDKFDNLNARYMEREEQMKALLNRLELRTVSGRQGLVGIGGITSHVSTGAHLCSSSSEDSDIDLRQLSPSLSIHLFAKDELPQG